MNKKYFGLLAAGTFAVALAATTASLVPTGLGTYSAWTPSTGTTHYTLVDESTCNGNTDYVSTVTAGARDSYAVSLASIPNGSTITGVSVTPCAGKAKSTGTANISVFYRLNGTNSADSAAYSLTGTTPAALAATNYSGLSTVKASSTQLEVGAVFVSGTQTARLSRLATVITYTAPLTPPNAPFNPQTFVSSSTNIVLTWTDMSTNEDGFWIEKSTNGTTFTFLATTTVASYVDTGLTSGTYYYKVRAYNAAGNSAFSSTTMRTLP